ncbi:MAG TPA: ABC transporter ATP-binding protein [Candidatus Acidoferrales bacterium]|nr:ABC transporter ATP-binding protein [Candidatus Acidoferrales bacterium]
MSKLYHIGRAEPRYLTLRDALAESLAGSLRRARELFGRKRSEEPQAAVWALKDVSFQVAHGEIVGIIGRNGAGKSTLLKILSRITEPTSGYADIRGRIGSLLEVGTGFHPELTGRENIYLNGAILGMSRAEITRKFDEIVDFSGVEKFIDTPVKHYSSGMHMRLAFAVAAHLETDILLVDEVLAVGDLRFQGKCLGKMENLANEGRTVLFVSHNLGAVEHLCQRAIVMQEGRIAFSGDTKAGIEHYLHSDGGGNARRVGEMIDLTEHPGRPPKYKPLLTGLELFTDRHRPCNGRLKMGAPLTAKIHFRLDKPSANFNVGLGFDSLLGQRVFTAHSVFQPGRKLVERVGEQTFVCEIPSLTLVPGEYKIKVALDLENRTGDFVEDAVRLTVIPADYYGTGKVPWNGFFVLEQRWHLLEGAAAPRGRPESVADALPSR